ncbi:MAG: hypothetical protein KGL90_14310 [Burkholderiales bacterium]|nr:hypothetical protein [Burkholderiales bacterium]
MSFFQDWMKAAGSALPHMQGAQGAASGGSGSWSMPTLDPDELDKRIQDLRTVQFWLEQNARLISMTIQGLEVQRMTLTTLRSMNVSMDAVRDSLKARASATGSTEAPPAPEAPATEPSPDKEGAGPAVNPMRWWDTLTQQFTTLASQAAQATQAAQAVASPQEKQAAAPQSSASPARPRATPKTSARKTEGSATSTKRRPAGSGSEG